MTTRSKYIGGNLVFSESVAHERVLPVAPLVFYHDFVGAAAAIPTSATIGYPFVKKTVQTGGTPTVARVANAGGGVVQLALDATSEKQEATFYAADELNFDVTKGLVFESRVKLSVLPSAAQVQAVFGLSSAWIDGPDNATDYVEFGATGNGAVLLRSQDGATQNSVASGTTVLATDWHMYRIDMTDPTHIGFFIDGVQQASATAVGFAATGASAILQPYMSVYKASGTGVGTMQVDHVRAWQNRQ